MPTNTGKKRWSLLFFAVAHPLPLHRNNTAELRKTHGRVMLTVLVRKWKKANLQEWVVQTEVAQSTDAWGCGLRRMSSCWLCGIFVV